MIGWKTVYSFETGIFNLDSLAFISKKPVKSNIEFRRVPHSIRSVQSNKSSRQQQHLASRKGSVSAAPTYRPKHFQNQFRHGKEPFLKKYITSAFRIAPTYLYYSLLPSPKSETQSKHLEDRDRTQAVCLCRLCVCCLPPALNSWTCEHIPASELGYHTELILKAERWQTRRPSSRVGREKRRPSQARRLRSRCSRQPLHRGRLLPQQAGEITRINSKQVRLSTSPAGEQHNITIIQVLYYIYIAIVGLYV